jgi:hypothetical protein
MCELDRGNRDCRGRFGLEPVQGQASSLDGSVVLLDAVVEVSAGPNLNVPPEERVAAQKPERPATRDVPIERYVPWSASMICGHGFAEERLRERNSAVRPRQETDRPAFLVERPTRWNHSPRARFQ